MSCRCRPCREAHGAQPGMRAPAMQHRETERGRRLSPVQPSRLAPDSRGQHAVARRQQYLVASSRAGTGLQSGRRWRAFGAGQVERGSLEEGRGGQGALPVQPALVQQLGPLASGRQVGDLSSTEWGGVGAGTSLRVRQLGAPSAQEPGAQDTGSEILQIGEEHRLPQLPPWLHLGCVPGAVPQVATPAWPGN